MASLLLVVILLGVILAAARLLFIYWLQPSRLIDWYKATLEGLGYKVIALPYHPFKEPLPAIHRYSQQEHKDTFHEEKHAWPGQDIVLTNTGPIVTLILLKPRLLQSFYSDDKQPLFLKAAHRRRDFNLLLKDSQFAKEDDSWKRKRKLFRDILNFDFIKSKVPELIRMSARNIQQLEEHAQFDHQEDHKIFTAELKPCFQALVEEVVVTVFLGVDPLDLSIEGTPVDQCLSQILAESRQHSREWPVWLLGQKAYEWSLKPKYRLLQQKVTKLRGEVKSLLQQKLQYSQSSNGRSYWDLYEALHYLKKQRCAEKDLLTMDEFISQFTGFVSSWNPSTANYLNMLFYYLSQHPEVYSKLRKAVRDKFKQPEDVTYYKLRDVDYLEWCLNETTRMYAPDGCAALRQLASDTYLDNIPLTKGTGLQVQMQASHYNSIFYKDPQQFDPFRWADKEPLPFTLAGFEEGSRGCPGKSLAIMVAKIATALLLLRYDKMELVAGSPVQMVEKDCYQPTAFQTRLWLPTMRSCPENAFKKIKQARLFDEG